MINILDYDYLLPKNLIAQVPSVPRDHSRLFIYNTQTDEIVFDCFYNLVEHLPKKSFLVLNNTRVLPARLWLKKSNGGKVLVLLLINELKTENIVKSMVDRKVNVGDKLFIDNIHYFTVIGQEEKIFFLKFDFPGLSAGESKKWLLTKLQKVGKTPVPLYLRKNPLSEEQLRVKYQTVFYKKGESVAAPTASLHFTDRVLKKLKNRGIEKYEVTLNVGLGTFAPIDKKNLITKKLHEEFFEIDDTSLQCIKTLKSEGKSLVAVGTTVVRTLESYANYKLQTSNPQEKPCLPAGRSNSKIQKTDLFIFPPYNFKMTDILITNFHLPKSSLMMLVEAFLQHKKAKKSLVELYQIAIKNHFRFYSFGDAMLII